MHIAVVDHVLSAIRTGDGQIKRRGEGKKIVAAFFAPARAAENHHRLFGFRQHVAQLVHVGFAGMGCNAMIGCELLDLREFVLHVFGQRQHHRARAARGGDVERMADHFLHTIRVVDAGHPFGHLAEHAPVIDFLKRFAFCVAAVDLADKQNHRCGILMRVVQAYGRVAGAGATRDKTDAGFARQFAVGVGHVGGAAFLTADHEFELVLYIVQCIQHREIGFAGYTETDVGAVQQQ